MNSNSPDSRQGVVACGHDLTAAAAREILADGGNAFDAAVAAHFAACVAEPVLASLGGGGFLLAHGADGRSRVYDFFAHTPRLPKARDEVEFYAIQADFGTVTQEFHIGRGSIATPGTVRGLFAIHRDLCRLPMARLIEPALRAARDGLPFNAFHAYIFDVIGVIYRATPQTLANYASASDPRRLVSEGEVLRQSALADSLACLARYGEDWFYAGEGAAAIIDSCARDGHLGWEDLRAYEVLKRDPLVANYRGTQVLINPPPSSGGVLIAFGLRLLETLEALPAERDGARCLALLAEVMALSNQARHELRGDAGTALAMFEDDFPRRYQALFAGRASCTRGTTHISIADGEGNVASLSASNGEGCGHMVTDTGIMLNNMLGEEDLHPGGFDDWRPNQRISSMMAPALLLREDGYAVALGSGGSNRLRTAILQVIVNLLDYAMDLEQAVAYPRVHFENAVLNVEPGFADEAGAALRKRFEQVRVWEARNMFFGGVHAVQSAAHGDVQGAGDPRRGGVAAFARP